MNPQPIGPKELLEQSSKDVHRLLERIRRNRVFFYPACGLNWQPLEDFRGAADLFVYCDWTTTAEGFRQALAQIPGRVREFHLNDSYLFSCLGHWDNPLDRVPWGGGALQMNVSPAWAWAELLELDVVGSTESAWLLYLAANPAQAYHRLFIDRQLNCFDNAWDKDAEAYRRLFAEQQKVPTFVYLKKSELVTDREWWFLVRADGELATAICQNNPRPKNILGELSTGPWPLPPLKEAATPGTEPFWLQALRFKKVCFYPACGFDWKPLEQISAYCDTFVYCDYGLPQADVEQALLNSGLELLEDTVPVDPRGIEEIEDSQIPPAFQPDGQPHFQAGESWGNVRTLRHQGRSIRLFYLHAEGVKAYWAIFKSNQLTPHLLCMVNTNGMNWTDFGSWDEPLAGVVRTQWPQMPAGLINTGQHVHGWPTYDVVKNFPDWHSQGHQVELQAMPDEPAFR